MAVTFGPKHEGCRRQFIHFSRAYYAEALSHVKDTVDEVQIGFYHPEGGTSGEFRMSWYEIHRGCIAPRLEAFDDAWDALLHFSDVLKKMAAVDGQNITPEDFCRLLESCGVEDATPVEEPK